MVYWTEESFTSEAKVPGGVNPLCAADMTAVFTTQGRKRLPFIAGIDIRLPHQLPGKPAAGAGPFNSSG